MSTPRVFNQQTHDSQRRNANAINRLLKNTNGLSSSESAIAIDRDVGVTGNVDVSGSYEVDGIKVVGNRETGWTADSGTAKKTANTTYTAPTISNPPTQAEVQAIANALQDVSRTVKALKDALITHGQIGT